MLTLQADEPALPQGLAPAQEQKDSDTPALPAGLGGDTDSPALPAGLGGSVPEPPLPGGLSASTATTAAPSESPESMRKRLPFDLSGFAELRTGIRLHDDNNQKDMSIGESRLHLSAMKSWKKFETRLSFDLLADPVAEHHGADLETGAGWFDLREAFFLWRATSFLDIKAGRQILTWGTGDMLFLNDMFPKDWNSFFIGRDTEYLKAPSDAIKLSAFSKFINVDLVYTPRFDADRFIDGTRISYWNAMLDNSAGRDAPVRTDRPNESWQDDEWSLRLYKNLRGWELAMYAYHGFWKSPAGQDASTGRSTFPCLSTYGASVRRPLWGGILNAELAYYDSMDDRDGNDPLVRNSESRLLIGFERELRKNLTGSLQYYVEIMDNHDAYQRTHPAGMGEKDETRQVITLRLTQLLRNQNLMISLFAYYSPADRDAYLRPKLNYKINDHWTVETGGNIFLGADQHTFFGQFEEASNLYASMRYSF